MAVNFIINFAKSLASCLPSLHYCRKLFVTTYKLTSSPAVFCLFEMKSINLEVIFFPY